MAQGAGVKILSNPFTLITILIGLSLMISIAVNIFPTLVTQVLSLSTLNNFTFSSFFESGGVVFIVLSAIILLAVLAILGIKGLGGGSR